MKIDSYTHFACPAFIDHLEAESGHPMVFRGLFSSIPELSDIDLRIRQVTNMLMLLSLPKCKYCCRLHVDSGHVMMLTTMHHIQRDVEASPRKFMVQYVVGPAGACERWLLLQANSELQQYSVDS